MFRGRSEAEAATPRASIRMSRASRSPPSARSPTDAGRVRQRVECDANRDHRVDEEEHPRADATTRETESGRAWVGRTLPVDAQHGSGQASRMPTQGCSSLTMRSPGRASRTGRGSRSTTAGPESAPQTSFVSRTSASWPRARFPPPPPIALPREVVLFRVRDIDEGAAQGRERRRTDASFARALA